MSYQVHYSYGRYTYNILSFLIKIVSSIFYTNQKTYSSRLEKKRRIFKSPFIGILYRIILYVDYLVQLKIDNKKGIIIYDRYVYDTVINDVAVQYEYNVQQLKSDINMLFKHIRIPDYVFLIDIDESIAYSRKDDIPSIEYLSIRREYYLSLINEYDFYYLDGSKNQSILTEEILKIITNGEVFD
jgi:thymidylate kinase